MITSEDLHDAADIVGGFGDDDHAIGKYGLPFQALKTFIDGSDWHDTVADGPERELDPLAMAMGVSIGVIAATRARRRT